MCAWVYDRATHPELIVGVPHTGKVSFRWFAHYYAMQNPLRTMISGEAGQPIDISRNIIVSVALQRGCEYVFFLDSDVIVESETLINLIESKLPIISAVYFARSPPYEICANIGMVPVSHKLAGNDTIIEVEQVGMGCCLINTRVLRRIGAKLEWRCMRPHDKDKTENGVAVYNWKNAMSQNFKCTVQDKDTTKPCGGLLTANFFDHKIGKSNMQLLSEDFFFCQLARSFGFNVMLHLSVVCGHELGDMIIDKSGLVNPRQNAALVE